MTTMSVVGECFFWYRLTRVVPDRFHRAVKRLCVCCVCQFARCRWRKRAYAQSLTSGSTNSMQPWIWHILRVTHQMAMCARGKLWRLWLTCLPTACTTKCAKISTISEMWMSHYSSRLQGSSWPTSCISFSRANRSLSHSDSLCCQMRAASSLHATITLCISFTVNLHIFCSCYCPICDYLHTLNWCRINPDWCAVTSFTGIRQQTNQLLYTAELLQTTKYID